MKNTSLQQIDAVVCQNIAKMQKNLQLKRKQFSENIQLLMKILKQCMHVDIMATC